MDTILMILNGDGMINSAIHQATGLSAPGRNSLQRPFSHSQLQGFFPSTGIVPVKARYGSASGLVTVLFTKLPTQLPSFNWHHSSGTDKCP